MPDRIKMTVYTSPVILPQSGVRRVSKRPQDQRQPGYEDQFDDRTLFYDCFKTAAGVELVGPPLLNLRPIIDEGIFSQDNGDSCSVNILGLDRTSVVQVKQRSTSSNIVTLSAPQLNISMAITPNFQYLYAGHKVLVTKSKNNNLLWIADWVKFHVSEQGIDAVLLYDNGSDAYDPEDVLEAIAVTGIKVAIVVHWPYKFGAQGGYWNGLRGAPWDSDFCEYGIMEHARRRFLSAADGVLNADIDELVMTEGGKTVFEVMEEQQVGALTYTGRWIESTGTRSWNNTFADYTKYDAKRSPTTPKWAIRPSEVSTAVQWKTHYLSGVDMVKTSSTMHRHFMAINLDWKWQRTQTVDDSNYQMDFPLEQAMKRAFGR